MRSFLLFLFGLTIATNSNAEWKIRNAFTAQLDLYDIHVDGDNIYALGYISPSSGVFLSIHFVSTNGGQTWTKYSTEGEFHKSIAKRGNNYQLAGFTPSGKSFIKTSVDQGATWVETFTSSESTGLTDIFYVNDSIGYASGYGKQQFSSANIFKTIDAGKTWFSVLEKAPATTFDEIQFISEDVGFAVSTVYFDGSTQGNQISKTTDGGKNWELIYTHSANLGGAWFIDENKGFLVDENGEIRRTVNGGKTWQISTKQGGNKLFDIQFTNGGITGMAVGTNGTVMLTENGGKTWKRQNTNSSNLLIAVRFFNQKAYTIGANGTTLWDEQVLTKEVDSWQETKIWSTSNQVIIETGSSLDHGIILLSNLSGQILERQSFTNSSTVVLYPPSTAKGILLVTVIDGESGMFNSKKVLLGD